MIILSARRTWITLRKLRSIQATPVLAQTMIMAEEAQTALRHCIREMHVREQEEDELWRKWQNLGFPKRPYKRMPDAPSDAGNPRAGFYKIAEP